MINSITIISSRKKLYHTANVLALIMTFYELMFISGCTSNHKLLQDEIVNGSCSSYKINKLLSKPDMRSAINKFDDSGKTPFHKALEFGNCDPSIILLLIQSGADVNLPNKNNQTPLRLAQYSNNEDLRVKYMDILIENGAIITQEIRDGLLFEKTKTSIKENDEVVANIKNTDDFDELLNMMDTTYKDLRTPFQHENLNQIENRLSNIIDTKIDTSNTEQELIWLRDKVNQIKDRVHNIGTLNNININDKQLKIIDKINTINEAEIALRSGEDHRRAKITNAINSLGRTAKYGVAILKASIYDISEYTEGTGFMINLYNSTKKTIKYVTVYFIGYNAVGDPVRDYRSRPNQLSFKCVGPIYPDMSATYEKKYAWMSDLVESFKITSIKVQYMDNSNKTIKEPNKIWIDSEVYDTLMNLR